MFLSKYPRLESKIISIYGDYLDKEPHLPWAKKGWNACRESWGRLSDEILRRMDDAALFSRLFPYRVCAVSTKEDKPPRRYLLSYTKHPRPLEVTSLTIGSEPYRALTDDFYL